MPIRLGLGRVSERWNIPSRDGVCTVVSVSSVTEVSLTLAASHRGT